jgi:hypothetical protein
MKLVCIAALCACTLAAQTPVKLAFQCTEDDMQWAGMTCSEQEPCPVYLELSNIAALGQKIFLTGDIHSTATTLYSVLLASEDAGATWREPFERIRGGQLDHIQFHDFEAGWVSGQMMQPLPNDPFLLLTADGGKTWRRHAVTEEGGPGSIAQFRFESRKDGVLLLDRGRGGAQMRYQLFETPNGGETWMIRETSDSPIKLRALMAPAEESGYRLRADDKSKSFRLEKQEAGKWTEVASFLVHVADCKPEPRPETPPPVTDTQKQEDFVQELRLGGPPPKPTKKPPK